MTRLRCAALLAVVVPLAALPVARAADLVVSANDAKFHRVAGKATYPADVPADTLTLLDAAENPPRVLATVEVQHSIHGPPQAVAITPDGSLAFVAAPDAYDYEQHEQRFLTFIQVVDLAAPEPAVIDRVEVGAHPQGLAVSPDGRLLLAALMDGRVAVLVIAGKQVRLQGHVEVGGGKLGGVSFVHDGAGAVRGAIVADREEQGLSVLAIDDGQVTLTGERIASGVTPYALDVSADGRWAVVSNVGLAAIEGRRGQIFGDVDSATLIDTSKRPFKAVQHLTVPATPEGIAISPDGRFIAVQSMAGSALPPDNPGRTATGTLSLFEIQDGRARLVDQAPSGEASQGVVFTADGRRLLVQMNVEKALALYAIADGKILDTGRRIPLTGGPTSIRSQPR